MSDETTKPTTWAGWHDWAEKLIETHRPDQVADTIADLAEWGDKLREALAAEAIVIEAQALSLSPRALGVNRRRIIETQVKRMYGCALGLGHPRSFGRRWRERAAERLAAMEGGES